ncbi:HAD-IA family hydrolase [Nakamurella deserti]|uniref:HAD-IA family hydrolase n=1 Tax=Nakamurella deserti TaxID=2164074 RepID=UPI0013009F37|nr:HAD-IA family hydrolase [Nakamurella deserti]
MHITVDAVLFDLDGTLADSTGSVDRSWSLLADRLGLDFGSLQGMYHGVPARQTLARLMPDASAAEVEEVNTWLGDIEASDFDGVVPIPGALAVLSVLPRDRWAIVTSGTRRLATGRIAAAGLPMPGELITADDVAVGKPDPAPYVLAAKRLGFESKRCLVVEDAPAGVASGLASGAMVLGLRTTHSDLGVPSVADLTEVEMRVDGTRIGVCLRSR